MEQCEWLGDAFFASLGVYYFQDFSGEEFFLSVGNKLTLLATWDHRLSYGRSMEVEFFQRSQNSRTRKLTSGEIQLEGNFFLVMFPCCLSYQPLHETTLSWVEILD